MQCTFTSAAKEQKICAVEYGAVIDGCKNLSSQANGSSSTNFVSLKLDNLTMDTICFNVLTKIGNKSI